jgi:hypothetical protein
MDDGVEAVPKENVDFWWMGLKQYQNLNFKYK